MIWRRSCKAAGMETKPTPSLAWIQALDADDDTSASLIPVAVTPRTKLAHCGGEVQRHQDRIRRMVWVLAGADVQSHAPVSAPKAPSQLEQR